MEQRRWTRLQLFMERCTRGLLSHACKKTILAEAEICEWTTGLTVYKLSWTLLTSIESPEPEIFNRKFSARKTTEVVHDGNWLLLTEIGTCTSVLLWNIDISAWESKVSPTCYMRDTGFRMIHLKKLVNTIEGIIKCFGILARGIFQTMRWRLTSTHRSIERITYIG